jgi:hypothetical protein
MKQTLIFNGTGVNYSWHLPKMNQIDWSKIDQHERLYLISGGSIAYAVFFARDRGLLKWSPSDFLDWNRHMRRVYRLNPVQGILSLAKLRLGVGLPLISEARLRESWAMAVKPEFFEVKMRELPPNISIPVHNLRTGSIDLASAQSEFADFPFYQVIFAATAIPKVFPFLNLGGTTYGDAMYAKGFIRWLKQLERSAAYFHNYNMIKNAKLDNGEYHCLVPDGKGKKSIARDNLKFLFGQHIASYPENFKKMGW